MMGKRGIKKMLEKFDQDPVKARMKIAKQSIAVTRHRDRTSSLCSALRLGHRSGQRFNAARGLPRTHRASAQSGEKVGGQVMDKKKLERLERKVTRRDAQVAVRNIKTARSENPLVLDAEVIGGGIMHRKLVKMSVMTNENHTVCSEIRLVTEPKPQPSLQQRAEILAKTVPTFGSMENCRRNVAECWNIGDAPVVENVDELFDSALSALGYESAKQSFDLFRNRTLGEPKKPSVWNRDILRRTR